MSKMTHGLFKTIAIGDLCRYIIWGARNVGSVGRAAGGDVRISAKYDFDRKLCNTQVCNWIYSAVWAWFTGWNVWITIKRLVGNSSHWSIRLLEVSKTTSKDRAEYWSTVVGTKLAWEADTSLQTAIMCGWHQNVAQFESLARWKATHHIEVTHFGALCR